MALEDINDLPDSPSAGQSGHREAHGKIHSGLKSVKTELSTRVSKGELMVNVKDYGAIGNGVADESAAFVSAITAVANGGKLFVPPGVYNNPRIRNAGKSIRVVCDNATFVQTTANAVIHGIGTWGTTHSATAISATTFTYGETVLAHSLTVANASTNYAAGDRVFVFSDDLIPERRPNGGTTEMRSGQYAVVHSVSGTTITLTQRLRDAFTTNIRIAKLLPVTMEVVGKFSLTCSDEALSSQWTNNLIMMDSLLRPVLDGVTILRGSATGISFRSCCGYKAVNYDISNLVDNTATNQLGYAFADAGSEFGYVGEGFVQNCRHGWTDLENRIAAGAGNPANYGRSYSCTVDGMQVLGSASDGISPHQGGEGHTFKNITVQGGRGAGFGVRGKNHQYVDCVSRNNTRGFRLITDDDGGESYGHMIVNPTIINDYETGAPAIAVANHGGATDPLIGTRTGTLTATINGGSIKGFGNMLNATNSTVRIVGNPLWVAPVAIADTTAGIQGTNSVVEIESLTMDYRANTSGASLAAVRMVGSASTVTVDKMRIRDTSGVESRMTNWFTGTTSPTHIINDVVFDARSTAGAISTGYLSGSQSRWRRLDGTLGSGLIERTQANASTAYSPGNEVGDVVMIRVSGTSAGSVTLGKLNPGNHQGQIVIVRWIAFSSSLTDTLTINSSSTTYGTQFPNDTAIVLSHRENAMFVWDSQAWRHINK